MVVHVILVAGGTGRRFGGPIPKQFALILDKPLIYWTISAFMKSKPKTITIASHPDWIEETQRILYECKDSEVQGRVVRGGEFRQDSSRLALESLQSTSSDVVLIHDAVRPLISLDLVQRVSRAAAMTGAAIPTVPSADSLVLIDNGIAIEHLKRDSIGRVQTPQGFQFGKIMEAHHNALQNGYHQAMDDAELMMRIGYPVAIVAGEGQNLKVTSPSDLEIASRFMESAR